MFTNVKEKVKENVRKAAVSVTKLNRTLTTSLGRTEGDPHHQGLPAGVKLFEMEGSGDMLRRSAHYSVHASLPQNFFQEVQQSGESIEEGIEEVWFPLEGVADRVVKRRDRLIEIVGITSQQQRSNNKAEDSSPQEKEEELSTTSAVRVARKNAALLGTLSARLQETLQAVNRPQLAPPTAQ